MRQFRIALPDYLSETHVKATKKLFSNLKCVKIVEEKEDCIIINVDDNMVDVINDLNVCDYAMSSEV